MRWLHHGTTHGDVAVTFARRDIPLLIPSTAWAFRLPTEAYESSLSLSLSLSRSLTVSLSPPIPPSPRAPWPLSPCGRVKTCAMLQLVLVDLPPLALNRVGYIRYTRLRLLGASPGQFPQPPIIVNIVKYTIYDSTFLPSAACGSRHSRRVAQHSRRVSAGTLGVLTV